MPLLSPWNARAWTDQSLVDRFLAGPAITNEPVAKALGLAPNLSHLGTSLGTASWPVLCAMATLGSVNLSVARAVEPHIDACAILAQAQRATPSSPKVLPGQTWGVYAAHPPGTRVDATPGTPTPDAATESRMSGGDSEKWVLDGEKQWCSLADQVSHALITATPPGGQHRLFAIDLSATGVRAEMSHWNAIGLRDIHTGTLHLEGAAAYPVGEAGWYVDRPGFAWGGIVVAAIWFGAAAALAGQLWSAAHQRTPDQVALLHIGTCEIALSSALASLRAAATTMDDPATTNAQAAFSASRARAVVAHVAEQVMTTVGHALGPGPLAFDQDHATRVADLTLYLRQHHAERDVARLGALALESDPASDA